MRAVPSAGVALALALLQVLGAAPARANAAKCEQCVGSCYGNLDASLARCATFVCQDNLRQAASACFDRCAGESRLDCSPQLARSHGHGGENERRLAIHPRKPATGGSWVWVSAIGAIGGYLRHRALPDCDVADALAKAAGSLNSCCLSRKPDLDHDCLRGRRLGDLQLTLSKLLHAPATELHRSLSWDEIKATIRAKTPALVILTDRGGPERPAVLVGYREPRTALLEDPTGDVPRTLDVSQVGHGGNWDWKETWYFRDDAVSGHIVPGDDDDPTAPEPSIPPRAAVRADFPLITDPSLRDAIGEKLDPRLPLLRACYEQAYSLSGPVPSPATLVVSFVVDSSGTPAWIIVKDAAGLPDEATRCLTNAISRWHGLFPQRLRTADTQRVELTFARLPAAQGNAASP